MEARASSTGSNLQEHRRYLLQSSSEEPSQELPPDQGFSQLYFDFPPHLGQAETNADNAGRVREFLCSREPREAKRVLYIFLQENDDSLMRPIFQGVRDFLSAT